MKIDMKIAVERPSPEEYAALVRSFAQYLDGLSSQMGDAFAVEALFLLYSSRQWAAIDQGKPEMEKIFGSWAGVLKNILIEFQAYVEQHEQGGRAQ